MSSSLNLIITLLTIGFGAILHFLQKETYGFFKVEIILYAIFMLVLSSLFNKRKNRFFNYMSEKALITFDIASKKLFDK